ncbi:bifunctional diguanylate cyclase/phosphodiesterase [Stenotrophomonas terrae]|uniref:bifunctional diguanylate cyclase/phosphodiesterase n=1 Tax=Stenotrophomonas terrae TaxID=405446 RepID=UPI0009F83493|nr:EAL domain-containing protein [Stenotrophomonas terrae]
MNFIQPDSEQTTAELPARRSGLSPLAWALAGLLLGLACTTVIAYREWLDLRHEAAEARRSLADTGIAQLQVPLERAASILRAMQTLFLANDKMDQAGFSQYYSRLYDASGAYTSMAFARRTQVDRPQTGNAAYRYELVSPYQSNTSLLGFDMVTQPANLAALVRARDTDTVTVSAPFALRQSTAAGQSPLGVTLRLPVYSNGATPGSASDRRAREIGALAIGIRLQPLIESALEPPVLEGFRVRIRDTDAQAQPFYDSGTVAAAGLPALQRQLDFGGRRWLLEMAPRPQPMDLSRLYTIIIAGSIISLLLSALLWSLATTQRKALALGAQMSARYRESELRFRALNELLPALVLLADARDWKIVYANQAARLRLGDPTGLQLSALFLDQQLQARSRDAADIRSGWNRLEAELRGADGASFWANASIAEVDVDGAPHLLMVATDNSEQRELTDRLSYQAAHDALTGLYNRREFERRVQELLKDRSRWATNGFWALLYIDLDQFKLINDVSGHMAGDQLLEQLALTMRQQLRSGDVLARLGGDEFGLLTFHGSADGALELAERLRGGIESLMFSWQGRSYKVSCSIGMVAIDQQVPTLKDLLAWADTACYMAKENGRNRVHVYRQDDETARRQGEMEWVNRLRWAMEQDRLLLDYQEIVSLTGEDTATNIELLLRLRDEDGSIVLPGAFLPAAERYGLMPAIDRWVIQSALSNFTRLHPTAQTLGTCAINLSGASIEDEGLADFILACIEEHRVPPQMLCFEITETVAVRNLLKVVSIVERLRSAGCNIALDDFGAGMSSFGYLKNLPLDLIKIDRSFIVDLDTDPISHTIISAIAKIGHQRGLKVVAEGVSTDHLCEAARSLGVDYAQGFGLHRPERVQFQR